MRYLVQASLLSFAALFAGCSEPTVEEYEPRTGIITGTLLYAPPEGPGPCGSDLRGNVVVTLFEADALPPPEGTSGPVNFIVVPESELFSGEPDDGVFTAQYVMPTVPAGRYQLRAFLDADGDFHPTVALAGQPTAGDVGGGHVDPTTGEFIDVEVFRDQITSQVTISVGRVIPVERPAFAHTSTTTFEVPYDTPRTLTLAAHPIDRPGIRTAPACTRFLVQYADLDQDGIPDDANGDNLPDLFPQVILRLIELDPEPRNVVVPGIIDPLPYLDALAEAPAVLTSTLTVLLPPVAVQIAPDGTRTVLPEIPEGRYETVVVSGTGQTWQVPNALDRVAPTGGPDPTQSEVVQMVAGAPAPSGGVGGTVRVETDAGGDVYVVAFDAADPPPPAGTGSPVGLASVPEAAFTGVGSMRSAPFSLRGLPDGDYLVRAILDADGSFSPLVAPLAQPSGGDYLGGAAQPVAVQGGLTSGVEVRISERVPFDRPAFAFAPDLRLSRAGLPARVTLESRAVPAFDITADTAAVPVALAAEDRDGDNLRDLLPRVLLTRMADAGDPRAAPDDPRGIVIPALVEPLPYYGPLFGGIAALPATRYDVIVPPVALDLSAGGARLSPPPAGRYRVNVLSATGQTWSVPNDLDLRLRRVGTARADPTQARVIVIEDTPLPRGAIEGEVRLPEAPPGGDFSVVVLAFSEAAPPPPAGEGRPVASAVVGAAAFSPEGAAPYRLGPLSTGRYTVRAFLDADDDFTPWYEVLAQPSAGDIGGGRLDPEGRFVVVEVDAGQGATPGVPVVLSEQAALPADPPAFALRNPPPVLSLATASVTVTLTALEEVSDIASVQGAFPIRWVDRDTDGIADDVNGDGFPDVFPLVVAERLEEQGDGTLAVARPRVRIPGVVDPRQFVGLGFPAGDPAAVEALVFANSLRVLFPRLAVSEDRPGETVTPPLGPYRVTVVSPFGQVWRSPNALAGAAGTPFPDTQGRTLTVTP